MPISGKDQGKFEAFQTQHDDDVVMMMWPRHFGLGEPALQQLVALREGEMVGAGEPRLMFNPGLRNTSPSWVVAD